MDAELSPRRMVKDDRTNPCSRRESSVLQFRLASLATKRDNNVSGQDGWGGRVALADLGIAFLRAAIRMPFRGHGDCTATCTHENTRHRRILCLYIRLCLCLCSCRFRHNATVTPGPSWETWERDAGISAKGPASHHRKRGFQKSDESPMQSQPLIERVSASISEIAMSLPLPIQSQ